MTVGQLRELLSKENENRRIVISNGMFFWDIERLVEVEVGNDDGTDDLLCLE
jgi:hypothetical protein